MLSTEKPLIKQKIVSMEGKLPAARISKENKQADWATVSQHSRGPDVLLGCRMADGILASLLWSVRVEPGIAPVFSFRKA